MDKFYHDVMRWITLIAAILALTGVCVSTGWYLKQLDTVSKNQESQQVKIDSHETAIAVLKNDIGYIKDGIDGLQKSITRIITRNDKVDAAVQKPVKKSVENDPN
jgi:septal ring factor EnvC (AmiA/AmiB activator)